MSSFGFNASHEVTIHHFLARIMLMTWFDVTISQSITIHFLCYVISHSILLLCTGMVWKFGFILSNTWILAWLFVHGDVCPWQIRQSSHNHVDTSGEDKISEIMEVVWVRLWRIWPTYVELHINSVQPCVLECKMHFGIILR